MKRLFISLFLATSCSSVSQASPCMTGTERLAFNVIALKSDLMVGALSCDVGEQYDAFMETFQPFIAAEQRVMDGYFARADGPGAVGQEDDYVTLLANSQSDASLREGANFCGQNSTLLGAIVGMGTVDDLVGFLTANPPPEPIDMAVCGLGGGTPAAPAPAAPQPAAPAGGVVIADNDETAAAGGDELASNAVPAVAAVGPAAPQPAAPQPAAPQPAAPQPAAPQPAAPQPAAPQLGTPVAAGHTPIAPQVADSVAVRAEKSLFRSQPLAPPVGDKAGAWSHPVRRGAVSAAAKHVVPNFAKKVAPKPNPFAQTQVI